MPPPAAPPMAAKGKQQSTGAMIFGIAGAVLMIIVAIGSALPWATAFGFSVGGLRGDGVITIIVAFLGLAFFAVGLAGKAKWPFVIGLMMSLIISAVAIYDAVDVVKNVTMGIGLILCIIGGVLGVVAGIGGIASPRRAA